MHYLNYKDIWKWQNFKPKEIACKCGCGELYIEEEIPEYFLESMNALQELRGMWKKPIILTSAHRCIIHNKNVGGSSGSQHLRIAFDCVCPASLQKEFIKFARKAGFRGIGRYPGRNFVHVDMGVKREWRG